MHDIDNCFKKDFPKLSAEFELKTFQKSVISNTVEQGNTLCIMPTGGGKSLIYWLSGIILGGITIVVSPLIALIDEQSAKISEQGFEVLTLHGGIDSKKQANALIDFANKKYNPKFVFVSPEKIATDGLFEYCMCCRKDEIKLFVIDEVHCVSQWGSSFRPFYRKIPDFINKISLGQTKKTRILALTATLNPKEVNDICNDFEINKSSICRDDLLIRSEISLKVLKFSNEDEKEAKFWDLIKIHKNEKILIYVYRISSERGVNRFSERATEKGYRAACFHGEMTAKERREIICKFKNNEINVVFATSAFGMGIDIPDIRVVIHYMIPESVEQYYQEIGRSARDGNAANAYLLYSNKNIDVKRKYFIDGSFPTEEKLIKTYKKIAGQGLGLHTLPYFEDEEIQQCLLYYEECGIIEIKGKGFSDFKNLSNVKDKELLDLISCSKTKNLVTTVKNSKIDVNIILKTVYKNLVLGTVNTTKPLDRRLILNVIESEISKIHMDEIQTYIDEKRKYKHELLDYLVFLLNDELSSNELHQEVGRYLGVDKHLLNRVYSTLKGDLVRSKSEVIIANLLYSNNIDYEYEKELAYQNGKWIEPDFTILQKDGQTLYWEHLGMLGRESYDKRWLEKIDVYDKYFKGQLVVTYEGATINDSAMAIINRIKERN